MSDNKQHKFTVKIADVEPFVFHVALEEEPIFRKAAYHVNQLWENMKEQQPGKPSHFILAKVALAFAELYYRKSDQLNAQSQMLKEFEKSLDDILLGMED